MMMRRMFKQVHAHYELRPAGFPAEGVSSPVLLPASSVLAPEALASEAGPACGVVASGVLRLDSFCFRSSYITERNHSSVRYSAISGACSCRCLPS